MKVFNKSKALVEEYLKITESGEVSSQQISEKRASTRADIRKYQEVAKAYKSTSKRREIVPKKGMEIE